MATPSRRTPAPGVMKFTILIEPFLLFITIHLVCLKHALSKKELFIEIHQFNTKLPTPGVGGVLNL